MHPLLKLYARNRKKGTFSASDPATTDATIYLYDMIVDSDIEAEFWGGVSPKAFIDALNALTAPTIHLRVNSPGGSVFAARAIEQAIREHKSTVIAHVDGLAASAASFLIMAADSIEMAPGAFLMIHKAWTIAYGNSEDMTKTATLLDQIDGSLVKTYAARTGQTPETIISMMADETWIDAENAVGLGFADGVSAEKKAQAQTWDLSAFSSAPKTTQEPPEAPPPEVTASRARAERLFAHYRRTSA
jgi:ATP-dependent Clp protease protease subunit